MEKRAAALGEVQNLEYSMVLKRNQETGEFDTPGSSQTDRPSLSICVECSKHESLKRFVKNHGAVGYRCGICHRGDLIASQPESYKSLSYLIRALVRFYYDEWAYNGHWGGDHEPAELLSRANPIVEHEAAPGFPRPAEDSEEFRVCLFDPPYPPYDKGIAIYAGHHEKYGRLPPLSAISTSQSPIFRRITDRLVKENYFEVEAEFDKHLSRLSDMISAEVPAGALFYRARIGVAQRFMRAPHSWTADIAFQPYLGNDIAAPPPKLATAGRLNRAGVSFLYLSTDENTAAAEVRPHPGHRVSIGAFRSREALQIADFGAIDIADFSSSDSRLDLFHLAHTISREISLPITPEEHHRYTITQLLADILQRQGLKGIRFPSSVGSGANLCAFQPALFSAEPAAGRVLYVKGLEYRLEDLDCLIEPTDDDAALP